MTGKGGRRGAPLPATGGDPLHVPFVDPMRPYRDTAAGEQMIEQMWQAVSQGDLILGDSVTACENVLAGLCGVTDAIGVGSGTDAIMIALLSLGISSRDEVITTGNVCAAVVEAIARTGATPVIVDIDPATRTIDPELANEAITSRTKAILPVHLHGLPADMEALSRIAADRSVFVVEAAAQALGASLGGRSAGSLGHVACFSFHPWKTAGAWGEGGALVTSDPEIAIRARALRDHGRPARGSLSAILGLNSRMDTIQSVVIRNKLDKLDELVAERRALVGLYRELLGPTIQFQADAGRESSWQHLAVEVAARDVVREQLTAAGIETRLHYDPPLYRHPAFAGVVRVATPTVNTDASCQRILSLPLFNGLTTEEIEYVCDHMNRAVKNGGDT